MSMLLTPCLCQVSNFIKGVEEDQLQSSASLGQACAYVCGVLPMRPPPRGGADQDTVSNSSTAVELDRL